MLTANNGYFPVLFLLLLFVCNELHPNLIPEMDGIMAYIKDVTQPQTSRKLYTGFITFYLQSTATEIAFYGRLHHSSPALMLNKLEREETS